MSRIGRPRLLAAAAGAGVLLVLLLAALVIAAGQHDTIAPGVTIAGIDVGGLSSQQATRRVTAALLPPSQPPLVLRYRRARFVLAVRRARAQVDIPGAVARALAASRSGNFVSRAWRTLTGAGLGRSFQPQVSLSHPAVRRLVAQVQTRLNTPARDAAVTFASGELRPVSSARGVLVRGTALWRQIKLALGHPPPVRSVTIPVWRLVPRVSTADLAARYPTIITVDRSAFTLRLWKQLRPVRSYRIAVGMQGLETPAGEYHIQDKEVDPSWHVPDSAWAGSLAGQTIPPGPDDPIKARWMGIADGAGIHGTDELDSLGSAASHGCIRMAIPDVIDLYRQVPVGTAVFIA